MKARLGFWSPIGILAAALALLILLGWTLIQGPVLFSPGPLNAAAKTQQLGGVSTHAELASDCGACHAEPWSAETMADRCLVCHQNVNGEMHDSAGLHGGLLNGSSNPGCRGCHTEHNGAAASLTALDLATFPHDKVGGYSLLGHERTSDGAKVGCSECHPRDLTHFDDATCADCHSNLDPDVMPQHIATFGNRCVPCHDGVDRYGSNFDHNKLTYELTGRHATVPCAECHPRVTTAQELQQTPQDCYSCHAENDKHEGAFGKDCSTCHIADDWARASFDHSNSDFPLTGAHSKVKCDLCHTKGVFEDASTDCGVCHAEPGFHAAVFGAQSTQCATCHTTTAWTPAEFTQAHDAIPIDHGAEEQTPGCKTCHPANLNTYTCYGCHEHTQSEIRAEHEGLSDPELVDCIRCHPGGQEGD